MSNSGELHTFPVSAGLLDPRHVQAIDPSSPLWIYLWLLNRVTRDEERGDDFLGIVLHGRSVSIRQIADELGIKERACRRHLARLCRLAKPIATFPSNHIAKQWDEVGHLFDFV